MGSGSKFSSNLSTRGGRPNIVNEESISSRDVLANELFAEMEKENTKFSKEKIVFIARLENGEKIFLETGGLAHIIKRHAGDFQRSFNVSQNKISSFLHDVIEKGDLITSYQYNDPAGRLGYRSVYFWKGKHTVIYGISSNGYINTAFPD